MDAKVAFIIVAALFTDLQLAKALDPIVQAACETDTANAAGRIKVTAIFDVAATALFALGNPDKCGTGATASPKLLIGTPADTTDSPVRKKYTFNVDATAAGTDKAACDLTEDGTADSAGFASTIKIVHQTGSFITKTTKVYVIKCVWDTPKTIAITSTNTVTGTITAVAIGGETLSATLEVHQNGAQTATVPLNAEDCQIVLKIPDKTKLVNEAKIFTCVTDSTATETAERKSMYDENGCGKTEDPWTNAMKFVMEDDNTQNSKIRYYKEPLHRCWKFQKVDTVYVQCQVLGCVGGAAECAAPTCPPSGKRRKRAVASNVTSERFETVFRVVNEITYKQGDAKNLHAQCLNNMTWMTVIGVLAILLLITLGVALYFGSKAMRRQGERKDGCPNPAYKA